MLLSGSGFARIDLFVEVFEEFNIMYQVRCLGKVLVKGIEFNIKLDNHGFVWVKDPRNNNWINVGQTTPVNSISDAEKCAIDQILYSGLFFR